MFNALSARSLGRGFLLFTTYGQDLFGERRKSSSI